MYINGNRAMAWVATINQAEKHHNADALDICTVGGWQCVTKRGEFQSGDRCVYISIDAWVPNTIAPFLSKGKTPRVYNGVAGERLRTVRLRGEISQGLILPVTVLPDGISVTDDIVDVTEVLGIQKWEMPVDPQLAGLVRGNFPSQIPKTDAERVQNINRNIETYTADNVEFEVTVKLDGSSMTVAKIDDELFVCSRNLSLKLDQEGNTFVDTAKSLDIFDKLPNNVAIQGELIGPKIQGNPEKLSSFEWYVFEVYDIARGHYYSPEARYRLVQDLNLKHVPVLHQSATLTSLNLHSVSDILNYAEGESLTPGTEREGIVFKNSNGMIKFKAISNRWLLKNDQ